VTSEAASVARGGSELRGSLDSTLKSDMIGLKVVARERVDLEGGIKLKLLEQSIAERDRVGRRAGEHAQTFSDSPIKVLPSRPQVLESTSRGSTNQNARALSPPRRRIPFNISVVSCRSFLPSFPSYCINFIETSPRAEIAHVLRSRRKRIKRNSISTFLLAR
jgi:hypothetical protein